MYTNLFEEEGSWLRQYRKVHFGAKRICSTSIKNIGFDSFIKIWALVIFLASITFHYKMSVMSSITSVSSDFFRPRWFVGNRDFKKSLWSFARVVRRDQVNGTRNADHEARTCERFVYSTVTIMYHCIMIKHGRYHSWEILKVRKGLWAFSLIVLFECWLAEQTDSYGCER